MANLAIPVSSLAIAYLILTALVFGFYGLQGMFAPQSVAAKLDLQISGPAGRTGIRALYGGFQLGFATLLIYFALAPGGPSIGLVVAAVSEAALVGARGYGMLVDKGFRFIHWVYLGLEVLALLAASVLLLLV